MIEEVLKTEMDNHLGYKKYELQVIQKHQKDISHIEEKIIYMYSTGTSTRDIVLGYKMNGMKEILSFWIGESETSKYWLTIFNELKIRGLKNAIGSFW